MVCGVLQRLTKSYPSNHTEQLLFLDVGRTLALGFVNHTVSNHSKSYITIFAPILKTLNILLKTTVKLTTVILFKIMIVS